MTRWTGGRARRRWVAAAMVLGVLAVAAVVMRRPLFGGNFGVVEPGVAYRSAQPKGDLGRTIERYGIGSVLNLRGGGDDDWWYAAEVEETRKREVDFYDLPLSATRRPTRAELLRLIDVLDRCRYPVLIHCKSGSDRTGMAAAIYMMIRRGIGPREALACFTLRYGHVPLLGPERLHEPFDEYAAWLKANALEHTPGRFERWVRNDYQADDPPVDIEPLRPGPRHELAEQGGVGRVRR